ncbi:hypothetical protein ABT158_39170 [Nonomuraea sp. NPDC001636]|uniref:DMT family transporter n=1 Tax=Nonomuraea sp. NPDC001636 TaxID=3154391 RepID=UPI003333B606
MNKWLPLVAAIVLEVTATLSLRAVLNHPAWFALAAVGYVGVFLALSMALSMGLRGPGHRRRLRHLGLLFGEPLTKVMGAGIGLITAGVLLIKLGAAHQPGLPESPAVFHQPIDWTHEALGELSTHIPDREYEVRLPRTSPCSVGAGGA